MRQSSAQFSDLHPDFHLKPHFQDDLIQFLLPSVLLVTRMTLKEATLCLMWIAALLCSEEHKGKNSVRISCSHERKKRHDNISNCERIVSQLHRLVKMFARAKDFI